MTSLADMEEHQFIGNGGKEKRPLWHSNAMYINFSPLMQMFITTKETNVYFI